MIWHSHSGMSGLVSRIGLGSSSVMRRSTPKLVSARNGARPVHIAYNTLPRLNKSLRWSTVSPLACSGDMYCGVPAMTPVLVKLASSAARASPKSVNFTRSTPSASRMLAGFTSR